MKTKEIITELSSVAQTVESVEVTENTIYGNGDDDTPRFRVSSNDGSSYIDVYGNSRKEAIRNAQRHGGEAFSKPSDISKIGGYWRWWMKDDTFGMTEAGDRSFSYDEWKNDKPNTDKFLSRQDRARMISELEDYWYALQEKNPDEPMDIPAAIHYYGTVSDEELSYEYKEKVGRQ